MMWDLSIVIPTIGREELLDRLLRSIQSDSLSCLLKFEVIVISHVESPEFKKTVENCGSNYGFYFNSLFGANHSRNLGITLARGKYILFLDDDIYLPRGFFNNIQLIIQKNEPRASCGFYLSEAAMSSPQKAYNAISNLWLVKTHSLDETPQFLGGLVIVPRDAIGGARFDPNSKGAAEEKYFAKQLQERATEVVINENISVFHDSEKNYWNLIRTAFFHGRASGFCTLRSYFKKRRRHVNTQLQPSFWSYIEHPLLLLSCALYVASLISGKFLSRFPTHLWRPSKSVHRI